MQVNFSPLARIVLGLIMALIAALVVSLGPDENTKQFIVMAMALFSAQGIVPPRPGDIHLSPVVNLALTAAAMAAGYFIVGADGIDHTLQEIIAAVIMVVSSVVITPTHPQPNPGG